MAEQNGNNPAGLDRAKVAEGLGELVAAGASGQSRVLGPDGKTIAYLKAGRIAVPTALAKGLPRKLGSAKAEKSGPWSNVAVKSDEAARAVLEFVVAKATDAEGQS